MKISFCTTCMGRLYHLSQTLPISLFNTASYKNREFVLLNYGSRDGLDEWVKSNLRWWIEAGIVQYFHFAEPKHFYATHAKNMAHKVATGDILCNLDADNYALPNFAEYLAQQFQKNVVVSSKSSDIGGNHGCCGKIATRREHFYSINGYDEDQRWGWGMDDTSFQHRVKSHNRLELVVCGREWNRAIDHSVEERTRNYPLKDIHESNRLSYELLKKIDDSKQYVVNCGRGWGKGVLTKNFEKVIRL